MLEILKKLCSKSGPSGCEDAVREYIKSEITTFADEVYSDPMGNLYATKKGKVTPNKKIMICAHMDEVGIIITNIDDDGYLRFDFLGGIDRRVIIGKHVYIGDNRIHGVIGIKAYHLVDKEEEKNVPKLHEMFIDIGAKSKAEAQELIELGDYGVFDGTSREFGKGFLRAKAIDDRVGCAAMIKLLKSELPCDCTFVFTVQEEVGARGAKIASYRINPDISLILEGTTAADLAEIPEGKQVCKLGEGVVIPFMDRGTIYSRTLFKTLTQLADQNDIKWQTKTRVAGGTDGQVIQRSRNGVETIAISAPIRNIHSPASIAKISDFETMPKLVTLLLEKLSKD